MVMRFSDRIRRSVQPNAAALNNGTIPGGLAYVLDQAIAGMEIGKDRKHQKEAMKALSAAMGMGFGGPIAGIPQATPEVAPQAIPSTAGTTERPAPFVLPSKQMAQSVLSSGGGGDLDRLHQAIIRQESGGRADAVSPVGARGIMQVMPPTAMDPGYGMQDIFGYAEKMGIPVAARDEATAKQLLMNPELNQAFGKDYYGKMRDAHGGSDTLALAAYNAGAGRVQDWLKSIGDPRKGGISDAEFVSRIPIKETRDYVTKIMGSLGGAQQAQAPQHQSPAPTAPQPTAAAVPQMGNQEAMRQLAQLAEAGNPYAMDALQMVFAQQQQRAMADRDWQFRQQQAQQEQAYRQAQLGMQQGTLDLQRQKFAADAAAPQGVDFGSGVDGRALAVVTEIETKRRQGIPLTPQEEVMYQTASAHLARPKFHFDQPSGRVIQTGGLDVGSMFGGAGPAADPAAGPGPVTPAPQVVQLPLTPEQEQAKAKQTQLRTETVGNVDSLLGMDLSKAAGPMGSMSAYVPGTDAHRIATRLDAVRNQFTGSNLDMLKGVLSDRDIQMLGEMAGGLRVGMPEGELERTLGSMRRILQAGQVDAAPAAASGGLAAPKSKAEYDALPSGTPFLAPDGTTRTKP